MNRSAYWAPAMLNGGNGATQKIVMPKIITLYYKSKAPNQIKELPQGIELLVGNVDEGGRVLSKINSVTEELHWGCYNPGRGQAVNLTTTIPGTNGTAQCPNDWDIQASIQFPECIRLVGGLPQLRSLNHVSHTAPLNKVTKTCPGTHSYRVPQISYLIRWDNPSGLGESAWRLSSDTGSDQPSVVNPGGSLHGDWMGGWYQGAIDAWIDGCFYAGGSGGRNCSLGQTGLNTTNRKFDRLTGSLIGGPSGMEYTGDQLLSVPSGGQTQGATTHTHDSTGGHADDR